MADKAEKSEDRRANLTRTEHLPSTAAASAKARQDRVAKPVRNSVEAQERDAGTYQESGEVVVLDTDEVEIEHPGTVVGDDEVNVRVKGTWEMQWGRHSYNFEDGKRYKLPRDLFNYLKAHRNIYDTM